MSKDTVSRDIKNLAKAIDALERALTEEKNKTTTIEVALREEQEKTRLLEVKVGNLELRDLFR